MRPYYAPHPAWFEILLAGIGFIILGVVLTLNVEGTLGPVLGIIFIIFGAVLFIYSFKYRVDRKKYWDEQEKNNK